MLKIFLSIVLALYLPLAVGPRSPVEAAKEAALCTEDLLQTVNQQVEAAYRKGDIGEEQWQEYLSIHSTATGFVHLFIMAVLYYEDAPNDTQGQLVSWFARDVVRQILLIESFCSQNGIEFAPQVHGEAVSA